MQDKKDDLQRMREENIPRGIASATPLIVSKAKNAELWDANGNVYVDFASGIAVVNTGHCNPQIIQAVNEQNNLFSHVAFQVAAYETYLSLAKRINALVPMENAKSVFFSTGAEAVENAVKIARSYTKRSAVISFSGAFHGRTLLTLALTGKVVPYKSMFGPMPPEIFHIPFPIEHHGISEDDSIAAFHRLIKHDVEVERIAAIIIEPVQGEGGFYIAPPTFMQKLRKICDDNGIVLICDEIQSGFARTGKLFAIDHYDIIPDIMTIAKAFGGGYPISGVVGKANIMDSPNPGGLGGTFGGSPIGCAAAHAVLDIIEKENLCERSKELGSKIKKALVDIKERNPELRIGNIRGVGAMTAFEIVKERDSHIPDSDTTKRIVKKALDLGVVLLSCGIFANTVRLLPPLTMEDSVLEKGLDILERALVDSM